MNEGTVLDTEQLFPDDNVIPESDPVTAPVEIEIVENDQLSEEIIAPIDEDPVLPEEPVQVFSVSGTYNGTISDTYLDYFEGIVQKLMPNEHYVIWRSGQYAYTLCYGENITLQGDYFSGDCNVVELYRSSDNYNNDWYVSYSADILSLSAGDLFLYSDLGMYPTVERGFSSVESSMVVFAIGFAVVYSVCHDIFDYILQHIYRK